MPHFRFRTAGTHGGRRFSRNAATPSLPSADPRTRAMRLAVSAITASSIGRPSDRADQRLRLGLRLRAGEEQRAEELVDPAVELVEGADVVDEPDAERFRRGEALGGQEIAPRLPRADRLDRRTDRWSQG